MARKRKASRPSSGPTDPREVDPADARLGPINTWEDVADSEDEFYINQDKIALEDEPSSKRRKQLQKEEEFLELSDEEVLNYGDDPDSDEDEEEAAKPSRGKKESRRRDDSAGEEEQGNEGEEGDSGWWGPSRNEYYNADNIETEADALEEEAEARRLQQKRLAKMSEADFIFDQDEWAAAPGETAAGDEEIVTEVLKDADVTDDMGPEERYRLLRARYPEFEYLVNEFQEIQPLLAASQKEAEGKPGRSLEVVRYWILGSYAAALASYFAILTSPARDGEGGPKPIDPAELRDHEVMETLVTCREAWTRVKNLRSPRTANGATELGPLSDEEVDTLGEPKAVKASTKSKAGLTNGDAAARKKKKAAEREKLAKAKEIEDSIADLAGLLSKPKKTARAQQTTKAAAGPAEAEDDHSDFGEDEVLDARTAADKAARKKSLRFYTSQIVQKANRRADAGRDAGGDVDIPYRERLRDREARLMAAAEKRGQKGSKFGADLGDRASDDDDNDNEADRAAADAVRGGDDEYYDMVAGAARAKKADKTARKEALAQASALDRVVEVEEEEIGEDGKRRITYAIEKNKGLAPRRKKEVRNSRVKKRKKYEERQKKLRSMRPVYKGGEGRGGYKGELSGIKTGLVKSVKL